MKKQAFVAYPANDRQLADLIFATVRRANASSIPVNYIPWESNDIPGQPLVKPILEKIDHSEFVVADITFLNQNVVFEIGYAIACQKRVFLVRNSQIAGDKEIAKDVGIFDTLGYFEYESFEQLEQRLVAAVETKTIPFNVSINKRAPVYIVEPQERSMAVTITVSRVKKTGLKYRSFNPNEATRLSALDAIDNVASAAGVIGFLQTDGTRWSKHNNIRAMFVAGLATGMQKPLLMLAHEEFVPPLDIRDQVETYRDEDSIKEKISEFSPKIIEHMQESGEAKNGIVSALARLTVGDPTAENEMTTLKSYFLQTDSFLKSLRGEVNLVVGRKGAGKTALFISLRDKIRSNKQNVVVDLKPEGYQLLKLKEEMLSYLSDGAKHHLLIAFWEYLILLELTYKVLEKDQQAHRYDHNLREKYIALQASYSAATEINEGDFSERLLLLSAKIAKLYQKRFGSNDDTRLTNQQVTELLQLGELATLKRHLAQYLEYKGSVWILFDNLDKGWSTQGVDQSDALILRCLIDAGRRIEREMRRQGRDFHCIVFVRNDVYDHVMKNSADYGKEMRTNVDWHDYDLLKAMLRLRLLRGLPNQPNNVSFEEIWQQVCVPLFKGENSATFLIQHSLMRPRNVLKLFNHCKGFAVNFGRSRIEEEDIEKGLRTYSQDLLSELDRELSDVFPIARKAIYQFLDCESQLSETEIKVLLREANIEPENVDSAFEFLLYYGIIGILHLGQPHFIYDAAYDLKVLQTRAARQKEGAIYIINPAFWPALSVIEVRENRPLN